MTQISKYSWLIMLMLLSFSCTEDDQGETDAQAEPHPITVAALEALDAFEDRGSLFYPFHEEDQFTWHVYPKEDRVGRRYSEMTPEQQQATRNLLDAALSSLGQEQINAIMQLEIVTRELEGRDSTDDFRHPGKYFLAFFGLPDAVEPWGWHFEGHHVSLNFTIVGQQVSVTPHALGSNPALVKEGPEAGTEIFKEEQAQGRALVKLLNENQLEQAWYSMEAPMEVLGGFENKTMAPIQHRIGLPVTEMNDEQQAYLEQLIRLNMGRLEAELAEVEMQRLIDAGGLDSLYFVWMGGLEVGDAHYYRIEGPTFILEYDNAQNNANHVHVVWRNPTNDFGVDYLQHHYETADEDHGHRH